MNALYFAAEYFYIIYLYQLGLHEFSTDWDCCYCLLSQSHYGARRYVYSMNVCQ